MSNDYRARKEERKKRWEKEHSQIFGLTEEGRKEAEVWLNDKKRALRKLSRIHIAVVLAPALFLAFFPPNPYEEPLSYPFIYLLAAGWSILVRAHYQDTWDYEDYHRAVRWYKRHYNTNSLTHL